MNQASFLILRRNKTGYTLVEVLISAIILAIAITAVVGIVRKGRELNITDSHRRQARILADSCLENSRYSYENYALLNAGVDSSTVIIDDRGIAADLTGGLTVTIGSEDSMSSSSGTMIPFKEIAVSVGWAEPERTETIRLVKRISPL